jgi:hypothetical protein
MLLFFLVRFPISMPISEHMPAMVTYRRSEVVPFCPSNLPKSIRLMPQVYQRKLHPLVPRRGLSETIFVLERSDMPPSPLASLEPRCEQNLDKLGMYFFGSSHE